MSVRILATSKSGKNLANRLLEAIPNVDEIHFQSDWIDVSRDKKTAWLGCYDRNGEQVTDYILQIYGKKVYIYSADFDDETGFFLGEFYLT